MRYMERFYKICGLIGLYFISPASFLALKFKISEDNMMLFRMTINITYYTTIVALFFLITNL
ncbi:hypothetical protein Megvenef_01602 [Candidatus Megaera venefica]|uniref:Uncharacterized protein n=1 Tax=Candidatus Megaera venefica TaxID=2055910 RepID=A0ABU5NER4_9RICK|nr:hypothetical protein [Candidatus Megaera venefica]